MKPAPFAYVRPGSVSEILAVLAEHGSDAAVLAGGQSLVPLLNLRVVRPSVVVDLAALAGFTIEGTGARVGGSSPARPAGAGGGVGGGGSGSGVTLGPLVRQAAVLRDPALAGALPLLALALPHVGHLQTRARGTVCGSIAHGDPLAELALAALVSGASVTLESAAGGVRSVDLDHFLDRAFAPRLRPDELVTGLTVEQPTPGAGHGFAELADGVTVGSAAVQLRPAGGGGWEIRLGLGLDRDRPLLATAVHDRPEEAVADLAATLAATADLPDDRHGSPAYRRALTATLARRALHQALGRLGGVEVPAVGRSTAARPTVEPPVAERSMVESLTAGRPTVGLPGPDGPGVADASAATDSRQRPAPQTTTVGPIAADSEVTVTLTLDGQARTGRCEARTSLADFVRDELGATAVRVGCEQGVCGTCTVLVGGVLTRSCLALAVAAEGAEVTTAAGLDAAGLDPVPLAAALSGHFALQCGFCAPGLMVTAATWLADRTEGPARADEAAVRELLSGTVCRCSGYDGMVRAVLSVLTGRDAPIGAGDPTGAGRPGLVGPPGAG